jgi:anthranilate phosphoribosyltransferase
LPIERVFVVHGEPGWDEPTPCGPFHLFDVKSVGSQLPPTVTDGLTPTVNDGLTPTMDGAPVGASLLATVTHTVRDPLADYGLPRCRPEDLAGGDAAHNAERLLQVFRGEDQGAHRHALLLGAALVLEVTGQAAMPRDALAMAAAAIDSGAALRMAEALRAFGAKAGATA